MSSSFLGEIRLFSFNYAPQGWALCNGQLLPINQNQALFSLLGTTYGGNGQTTFALPDLRGRAAMHSGNGHNLGEKAGEASHTLTISELPQHLHFETASTNVSSTNNPTNALVLAQSTAANLYASGANSLVAMAPNALSNIGGSQPHENMQPYTVINFCISLQGIFPSQN